MIFHLIDEIQFSPKIVAISVEGENFFEYAPLSVNSYFIDEIQWMDAESAQDLVQSLIEKSKLVKNAVDGETLIMKYPKLKSQILSILRNKKLADILDNSNRT